MRYASQSLSASFLFLFVLTCALHNTFGVCQHRKANQESAESKASESNLTATEQLIGSKIFELGGEWEGPGRMIFVSYYGPKFKTDHFEYLSHLPSLKILDVNSATLDSNALSYISTVAGLEELTIRNCSFDNKDIGIIANCKNLRRLELVGVELSKEGMEGLVKLNGLKYFHFEDAPVSSGLFKALEHFKQLEECTIVANNQVDASFVDELKKAIPDCEFIIQLRESKQAR
jgi:hypothetical protein